MTTSFETALVEYDDLIKKLRELRRKHINRGQQSSEVGATIESVVDASVVIGSRTNLLILRLVREHIETCADLRESIRGQDAKVVS